MPIVLTEIPQSAAPRQPPRKRWTRTECAALEASGLFEQERLELVEGELISKMGENRRHVNSLTMLRDWLIEVFGLKFVNTEAPIDVAPEDNPANEPEPDIIVLKREHWKFESNPLPEDLHLVVEVSNTSVNFDLSVKAALYARAGISEYWVLDVKARRLLVHRDPKAGRYTSVVAYGEGEQVVPLAAPGREFRVSEVFPPLAR